MKPSQKGSTLKRRGANSSLSELIPLEQGSIKENCILASPMGGHLLKSMSSLHILFISFGYLVSFHGVFLRASFISLVEIYKCL